MGVSYPFAVSARAVATQGCTPNGQLRVIYDSLFAAGHGRRLFSGESGPGDTAPVTRALCVLSWPCDGLLSARRGKRVRFYWRAVADARGENVLRSCFRHVRIRQGGIPSGECVGMFLPRPQLWLVQLGERAIMWSREQPVVALCSRSRRLVQRCHCDVVEWRCASTGFAFQLAALVARATAVARTIHPINDRAARRHPCEHRRVGGRLGALLPYRSRGSLLAAASQKRGAQRLARQDRRYGGGRQRRAAGAAARNGTAGNTRGPRGRAHI